MKSILGLFAILTLCTPSFAREFIGTASSLGSLNTLTTNLGTTYNDSEGVILSSLGGKSNLMIYNGSSLGRLAVSFGRGNAYQTCTGAEDNLIVPASTGLVIEDVLINKVVCIRAAGGSAFTSGIIDATAW